MKKSGFTLIELLAVIAILAIILVISIPKILDVIETSKINTLKNAVKLIADSAEKKYTENEAFLEEEEITCESVSKLNKEDYCKCSIVFDENGIAKVSIVGKGKFKGLKVIEATKTSAEVIKLEAPKYGITAVEYINGLYEYYGDSYNLKTDNTKDQNVRYYGSNPNNYVSFNNELWRIIGVFNDNVKLVRKDSLGNLSWDSNDKFLTIDETSKVLIDNHTWNIGAVESSKKTDTLEFYKRERGTNVKTCTSGSICNDNVIRTTILTGYVALPYVTDWAYVSSESICETNMQAQDDSNNYICKNNNWINNRSTWTWYLTPSIGSGGADRAWDILYNGSFGEK